MTTELLTDVAWLFSQRSLKQFSSNQLEEESNIFMEAVRSTATQTKPGSPGKYILFSHPSFHCGSAFYEPQINELMFSEHNFSRMRKNVIVTEELLVEIAKLCNGGFLKHAEFLQQQQEQDGRNFSVLLEVIREIMKHKKDQKEGTVKYRESQEEQLVERKMSQEHETGKRIKNWRRQIVIVGLSLLRVPEASNLADRWLNGEKA